MYDDPTLSFSDSQPSSAEPALAQTTWGSFKLLARVGHGGFGEVYRAWDPSLEREVALKLLLPSADGMQQSDGEYKAMLREARALASVRHPNIVPVYGIDRHDGRVGFWTDFVKGKTLSALLESQGPFGYREAALIGLDVTRALSAVHRAGILHRDIKAANVMREEGGRILLMDFGLSALPHGQTNTAGTPNYMAPELWQGHPATVQTDIYAMGVLLYYLVTGEHPVRLGGLSAKEAVEALSNRKPLMDLRSDLPESFLRMVATAMEADPAKRFASSGQLAAALAECLGTTASQETSATNQPKKSWKSSPLLRIAAAALILGAAALASRPIRAWLHPDSKPTASTATNVSTASDDYIHAQELLQKSYSDANIEQAIQLFKKIPKDDPTFALAQAGLGSAYFAQYQSSNDEGQLHSAEASTNDALRLEPQLASALAISARIEANAGNTDVALQQAKQAVAQDPHSAVASAALAKVLGALNRTSDAITELQRAIDLSPENSMLLVQLGNYYMSAGDFKGAEEQWQKAIEIDPKNTFAFYDLGVVDMRLDKLTDARHNFEEVLASGPDADSYKGLGNLYILQGNYAQAIEMDKKAIALEPSSQEAWANLGSAYLWSGGGSEDMRQAYGKAIELAEKQRKKTPDDAELLVSLADYYASIGKEKASLPLARRALALSPKDLSIAYRAGETYELAGQRMEAIELIARAVAQGTRVNEFQRSPELASLRNDPAFKAALEQMMANNSVDTAKKMN